MKEVKKYILVISFTYIAIILFLIFNIFINKSPYFEVSTSDQIISDFESLKLAINDLKSGECKNTLSSTLNSFLSENYNGKVRINKLHEYLSTDKILNSYKEINKSCNISNSELEKHDIANKYLTMFTSYDNLITNHLYQYELSFSETSSKEVISGINQVAYNTLKNSEIELLNDYLRILGER